jgi:hypothetical protein
MSRWHWIKCISLRANRQRCQPFIDIEPAQSVKI